MTNNYANLKSKALILRKKGLSYGEIRKEVKVSKSTLSIWLKSVKLKSWDRARLYTKQIEILSRNSKSIKERRAKEVDNIIETAQNEIILPIPNDTLRLMGACLYWAEGSKKKMCEFTNSDPSLILFFTRWLKQIFKIAPADLKARLNIYPQQSELEIKCFWSDLTGIPRERFGKTFVKPLSKNYKKNNLYYGTIRIEVPRSVDINYRIYGWIKAITASSNSKLNIIQRKWQSLAKVQKPVNL